MRAGRGWAAALWVVAMAPGPAVALTDADTLYCAQVYARVADDLAGSSHSEEEAVARDVQLRFAELDERDIDLLNDNPARHRRALASAEARLPTAAGQAGRGALRAAYQDCRRLQQADAAPSPPERVRLLGERRFCRELFLRMGSISPQLRVQFNPDERAMLDEVQQIVSALAQPLPGPALSPEESREASRITAERQAELNRAVVAWRSGRDPLVLAMSVCHEDYLAGRLGGPRVLAETVAAATPVRPATSLNAESLRLAPVITPDPKQPAVAMPVDLGPVFRLRETVPGGGYEAIWLRRDDSNVYTGLWVHLPSGQLQEDELEVRGIKNGELVIHRRGIGGEYRARVRAEGGLAAGTASWFASPAYRWQPLPVQRVRARQGDLGLALHVRERSAAGEFEGIWRRRGKRNVYDAVWVHRPSGKLVRDVMVVEGLQRGHLILRRLQARGCYSIPVQADGRLGTGTALWGDAPAHAWEVVPAQALWLPATAR